MSSMDIDRPLDDLVAASKKNKRGGNKTRGAGKPRSSGPTSGRGAKYAGAVPSQTAARGGKSGPLSGPTSKIPASAGKIVISGLPADVTEPQIKVRARLTRG